MHSFTCQLSTCYVKWMLNYATDHPLTTVLEGNAAYYSTIPGALNTPATNQNYLMR